MNMYNKLPYLVYLKNEKYFINTDYRIFIEFEEKMQGKNTKQVIYECLERFYPDFFRITKENLLNEAVDQFIWFYKCGKKDIKTTKKGKSSGKKSIFSYSYDDQIIWGAYHSQFNIDLSSVQLHWWKFKSMWLSLSSECEFTKIRGYRAYTGKDKDLLELKELHKLPPNENEFEDKQRQKKIFDELNKVKTSQ
jgi:hypothetical protein